MAGTISFSYQGWDKARRSFLEMGLKADVIARQNVQDMSMRVIQLAQRNFEGSHAKGEPHVGGNKPNVVTGSLRRSIQAQGVQSMGLGTYKADVGPTAVYGRRIELGYKNRSRPFPYFGPAVRQVRNEAERIAFENWSRIVG